MAESYSTSLKLTIIGAGDLAGTWGNVTNANLGTLLEQAITGVQAINISGLTTYTLTNINGALDDARNAVLVFQGGTSACTITCPGGSANKVYAIVNQGSYPITMSASGGSTTLVIPGGMTAQVYLDGTNQSGSGVGVYSLLNGVPGDFKVVGTLTASGETDTGNMSVGGTLSVTGTTTLSGTSTAPTPSPGDNSTKIATTAFVNNITGSLGTMSQQNANSVAITGGNINGTIIGNSTAAAGTFTTLGGTTITASSQFSGPGTGLTGTAASLSIGGNAATATSATSATTATTANALNTSNSYTAVNYTSTGQSYFTSPNSGSTGAVILRDATGNPNTVYLQATNNTSSAQYGFLKFNSDGSITTSGTVMATTFTSTVTTGTAPFLVSSTTPVANLSIGGNAATATNATNATRITNSGGWNVTPTGTKLYFNYNGTNVGSLDSSGNFIVTGNITAYGTP